MLVEAMVGQIMEAAHLIATEPTLAPEEALDVVTRMYSSWTSDAAKAIKDTIQRCEDEADETRPTNETVAKNRIQGMAGVTDHQKAADQLQAQMKALYPWNNWMVSVAEYSKYVCYFDYACDDAVSCSHDTSRNNADTMIVQIDSS